MCGFFNRSYKEVRDHFRYHVTPVDKAVLQSVNDALKAIAVDNSIKDPESLLNKRRDIVLKQDMVVRILADRQVEKNILEAALLKAKEADLAVLEAAKNILTLNEKTALKAEDTILVLEALRTALIVLGDKELKEPTLDKLKEVVMDTTLREVLVRLRRYHNETPAQRDERIKAGIEAFSSSEKEVITHDMDIAYKQYCEDEAFKTSLAMSMKFAFISYDFGQGGSHNRLRRRFFGENSFDFTDRCKSDSWQNKKYGSDKSNMSLTIKGSSVSYKEDKDISIQNLYFVFNEFFGSLLEGKTGVIPKGSRGMYLLDGFRQTIVNVLSDGDAKFKMECPLRGFMWYNKFSLSQDKKNLVLKSPLQNDLLRNCAADFSPRSP